MTARSFVAEVIESMLQAKQSGGSKLETAVETGYVVGVDIGGTNLRLALADMSGAVAGKWAVSTAGIRDPEMVVRLIEEGVDALFAENRLSRSLLRGIAAGAPGVTDADEGIVIATSYLMGWRDVPLRALLEDRLGVPAAVENDVNTGAVAESRIGAGKGVRDFVFLAIGTGIGAGIVLHGKLFQGMGWSAGEVGYMLVPGTSVAEVASGEPGALESIVGGEGIKSQWQSVWSPEVTKLPKNLMATQVFDHALAGDALAQTVLQKSAQTLAYAIYNLAVVLNCPLFVLGGSIGMHTGLWQLTKDILSQRDKRLQPSLVQSTLGADAQLHGAVHLALDAAASRVLSN